MAPSHVLIQLTDLHVLRPGDAPREGVDTLEVLDRALRQIRAGADPVSAVLLTGDLTEHGDPVEYARLRAVLDAADLGVPFVFAPGNHDDRAALRAGLLDAAPSDVPLDHVLRVGDLRIVVLDSTVPGAGHGELEADQLAWLRAELAEPAPAGTVLALHHPPLPSPVPLSQSIELRSRGLLGAAIAGSDVRIVLAGHTHVTSTGLLAGVPVWTGGPIFTIIDSLAPDGTSLRTFAAPSLSRIDLYPDGDVMASAVPVAEPVLVVP